MIRDREITIKLKEFDVIDAFESQGVGIVFFSGNFKVLRASNLVTKYFGSEIINQNISFFLPKKFRKRVVDSLSLRDVLREFNTLQKEDLFRD